MSIETRMLVLSPAVTPLRARRIFRKEIITHAAGHLRPYFWRIDRIDPFAMLVIEILLVRTRAEIVASVAKMLLIKFPTPKAFSTADLGELENLLRPLGLFKKRAEALVNLGIRLLEDYHGEVPNHEDKLLSLPYVGKYTANAVLCFHFNQRRPVVDTNVARVFSRYFGAPLPTGKLDTNCDIWNLAKALLPKKNAKTYNWSLIDLGGTICTRIPKCNVCPLLNSCKKYSVHPSS